MNILQDEIKFWRTNDCMQVITVKDDSTFNRIKIQCQKIMDMPPGKSIIPLCGSIADCNYVLTQSGCMGCNYSSVYYSFRLKVISFLALKGFRLRAIHFHTNLTYQVKAVLAFSTQCPARPNAKLLVAECQYINGVAMA